MITVQVWDRALSRRSTRPSANPGSDLNPQTEGQVIRVPIPDLNEERRREPDQVTAKYAEQAQVSVSNVRRDGIELLRRQEKDGEHLAGSPAQAAARGSAPDRRRDPPHRRHARAEGPGNPASLMQADDGLDQRRGCGAAFAAAAHRRYHGRQRPLGTGAWAAAHRRSPPRRRSGQAHGLGRGRARHSVSDPVRLFVRELEAVRRARSTI